LIKQAEFIQICPIWFTRYDVR